MRFFSKRLSGSFTVEASLVMPLVIFIMIGMLYYICFLHDLSVMRSFSLRTAEAAAVCRHFEGMTSQPAETAELLKEKVVMSHASEPSVTAQPFSLRAIYRSMKSYHSADAQCSMSLQIPVLQTAVFTGNQWDTSCKVTAMTVDYPADWFKYYVRKKLR